MNTLLNDFEQSILNRDEKVAALKLELEKLETVLYDKSRKISKKTVTH